MSTPIVYSAVAKEANIAFEHEAIKGGWRQIVKALLERRPPGAHTKSYLYEEYTYNYIATDDSTFFCVAEQSFSTRTVFAFLGTIADQYGETMHWPHRDFKAVLLTQMDIYNRDPRADKKLTEKALNLRQSHDYMVEDIENVLEHGESLDDLMHEDDAGGGLMLKPAPGPKVDPSGKLHLCYCCIS